MSKNSTQYDCTIESLSEKYISSVKEMTDEEIGHDYYSLIELENILNKNLQLKEVPSFVLIHQNQVVGVRLTLAPMQWEGGKGNGLTPDMWPCDKKDLAYFQSLFIKKRFQQMGWGKTLSLKSIDILKKLGSKGVLCHSWVESPGDSSRRYLRSLGFKSVKQHSFYWKDVDYYCPRCSKPCLCTAEEMVLKF